MFQEQVYEHYSNAYADSIVMKKRKTERIHLTIKFAGSETIAANRKSDPDCVLNEVLLEFFEIACKCEHGCLCK